VRFDWHPLRLASMTEGPHGFGGLYESGGYGTTRWFSAQNFLGELLLGKRSSFSRGGELSLGSHLSFPLKKSAKFVQSVESVRTFRH
jgi:hypothetical protein